jgi:hypothetical protein
MLTQTNNRTGHWNVTKRVNRYLNRCIVFCFPQDDFALISTVICRFQKSTKSVTAARTLEVSIDRKPFSSAVRGLVDSFRDPLPDQVSDYLFSYMPIQHRQQKEPLDVEPTYSAAAPRATQCPLLG